MLSSISCYTSHHLLFFFFIFFCFFVFWSNLVYSYHALTFIFLHSPILLGYILGLPPPPPSTSLRRRRRLSRSVVFVGGGGGVSMISLCVLLLYVLSCRIVSCFLFSCVGSYFLPCFCLVSSFPPKNAKCPENLKANLKGLFFSRGSFFSANHSQVRCKAN